MAVKRESETKGWSARNNATDALLANQDRQIDPEMNDPKIKPQIKEILLFCFR
jgi:hypothetical protein